jgi:hypothetical protein
MLVNFLPKITYIFLFRYAWSLLIQLLGRASSSHVLAQILKYGLTQHSISYLLYKKIPSNLNI